MTGLWGWEQWDEAVRIYYRTYSMSVAEDCEATDYGLDDDGEQVVPEEEVVVIADGEDIDNLPDDIVNPCVCPSRECVEAGECDVPDCCLPPVEEESESSEPEVISWDEYEYMEIDDSDFDDIPEEDLAAIEEAAASRDMVMNSAGDEFYTGKYQLGEVMGYTITTDTVAVGTMGLIAIIAILAGICCCCCCRSRKKVTKIARRASMKVRNSIRRTFAGKQDS